MIHYVRIGRLVLGLLIAASAVMAQNSRSLRPDVSPLYQEVLTAIEQLDAGQHIQVFLATERDAYMVGEPVEARFAVSKDCHVALMRIATNGTLTFLMPNRQNPQGAVKGGVIYSTGRARSGDQAAYALGVDLAAEAPTGSEVLNLFCSPDSLTFFDAEAVDTGLYTVQPDDEEGLRAVLTWLDRLKTREWSGTSVAFLVEPDAASDSEPAEERQVPEESTLLEKSALIPDAGTQKSLRRKFGALKPMGGTGSTGKRFPAPGTAAGAEMFPAP